MHRRLFWIFLIYLHCLFAGCDSRESSQSAVEVPENVPLTVFAAASLNNAFNEVARAFEQKTPGVIIHLNLAGSQQLAQQIIRGAPADVFASANQLQMEAAIASKRIAKDTSYPFLKNQLVIVSPINNKRSIQSIEDLMQPGLKIILADASVPAGYYSRVFLNKTSAIFNPSFSSRVLANVVSNELNVRSVLTKIALGEADAGIVYRSDLIGASNVQHILIPDSLNIEAIYPIAPLTDSPQLDLANNFIDFVQSREGQAILAFHGFDTIADTLADP